MIFHVTFTDGYFKYAELFLQSLRRVHGTEFKVVLTTTDLSADQMEQLVSIYDNLVIHNKPFNYGPICKALNRTEERIKKIKSLVEHDHARHWKYLRTRWKMHVAAENRVKIDIPFVMEQYKSEDLIVHFDVDMCIMKPLDPLFKIMSQHDFTVMYRPSRKLDWQRIWMCVMGIKTNGRASFFMKQWGYELDKIPLEDKPFAYGQTSCYNVYHKILQHQTVGLGNIHETWIADAMAENKNKINRALVLSGHNPFTGGKDVVLKKMRQRLDAKEK